MDVESLKQKYNIDKDKTLVLHVPPKGGRSPHVELEKDGKQCTYGSVPFELNREVMQEINTEHIPNAVRPDLEKVFNDYYK